MSRIETLNQKNWRDRSMAAIGRGIAAAEAILISATVNPISAFAEEDTDTAGDIQSAISNGLQDAWKVLRAIGIPVAIIAIAFCAFEFFLNGDKGMEVAKKRVLYVIMGVALLLLAPLVIVKIAGWFSDNSSWQTVNFGD